LMQAHNELSNPKTKKQEINETRIICVIKLMLPLRLKMICESRKIFPCKERIFRVN
jgi:hypothetical protein